MSGTLSPRHAELIQGSSIKSEIANQRGYRTVTKKVELSKLGFSPSQQNVPGLLIPIYNPQGEIASYQLRPDEPRVKDGKPLKYETPGSPVRSFQT